MVQLAVQNASEMLKVKIAEGSQIEKVLRRLKERLRLPNVPEIIECLDITNLMGKEAYGSVVVFERGKAKKGLYRLYSIRTLETPNDYGMMKEVMLRRFGPGRIDKRCLNGSIAHLPHPHLILVDGGKGQLNIARHVLDELGLSDIPVVAISKTSKAQQMAKKEDKVFILGRKNPVRLKAGSPEMLLLQNIRDEAHRFGIKTHRRRRVRNLFQSSKD